MAGPMDFLRNTPFSFLNNNPASPYNTSSNLLGIGLGLLSGKTAQEQVANAATNFANDRQMGKTYNKTLQFLEKSYPDLAEAVKSGAMNAGDAWKLAYQQKIEAEKPKNNFMSVGKNLYNTQTGEWVTPPAGGGGVPEFGLQPVWGQDAQGNPVIGQLSKEGTFRQTELPEGFQLSTGTGTVDLGTHIGTIDKRTGALIATEPKALEEAEAQKKRGATIGEAEGAARMAVPGSRQRAATIIDKVDRVLTDPALDQSVGSVQGRLPSFRQSSIDFDKKIDQLRGEAFLEARQMLKGGGAITDFESARAEAAIARLDQAQSEAEFRAALQEFKAAVASGVQKLEMAAGGGLQTNPGSVPNIQGGTTGSGVQWRVK